ncbi:MAG: 4-(cytidine 5'-diphospho)-2-C-methyl-D-erythritol kinase [Jatrophihabitantaceae bacterium]
MSAAPTNLVAVRVPAKVNLHLGVGPLRPDGYHELITVFHAVDLCDVVTVRPAEALSVQVVGEGAGELPTDAGNLAWQAARLLATQAGVPAGVAIVIEKAIPVAGGMAGGSADAAATLLACARLWGLAEDGLPQLATRLGSDVAFGLAGGTALGTGRGEQLEPVPTGAALHWVFAVADFGLSTRAAYLELDRLRAAGLAPAPAGSPDTLLDALRAGDADRVAALLVNDLQPVAVRLAPILQDTLDAGTRLGALAAIVSGSGPTCAFLCADAGSAARLADTLAAEGVRTRTASGPTSGATVIS